MSEIKPALTPEEWAWELADEDAREANEANRPEIHDGEVLRTDWGQLAVAYDTYAAHFLERPHRAAALALHGQTFGFTWEDYDRIVLAASVDGGWGEYLVDIADRIAALLPPREP